MTYYHQCVSASVAVSSGLGLLRLRTQCIFHPASSSIQIQDYGEGIHVTQTGHKHSFITMLAFGSSKYQLARCIFHSVVSVIVNQGYSYYEINHVKIISLLQKQALSTAADGMKEKVLFMVGYFK